MAKSKSAYVVIVHGSRDPEANEGFEVFLNKFRQAFQDREVYGAFLELVKPSIPEAIEKAIQEGATEVFILPMMFFPGRHVKKDIPAFIQEAKAKHPAVDFHYASPVADHPLMLELLKEKAKAAGKKP